METELKGCEREKEHRNYATTTDEVNGSLLLLLPTHLIFDILARLSVYSVFTCKCVCRTFRDIISDPYFIQLHLAKVSSADYSLVIQEKYSPSKIFLTPLIDLDKDASQSEANDHCDTNYFSWQTLSMPAIIHKKKNSHQLVPYLTGSCNGLLCLRYYGQKVCRFCICNPILGEFTILPQLGEFDFEFGGFGFCPKTKQYKVLLIPQFGHCYIFTLGTDEEWRRISDVPPTTSTIVDFDPSYKGNLHWVVNKSICCFNLETERYSCISLPSCFNKDFYSRSLEIGTLDGLFCVASFSFLGRFEVCVMADYEVKGVWIKRVSVDIPYKVGVYRNDFFILRFLDNGVLLLQGPTSLIYYDTRKGTSSHILVEGNYCAKVHFLSLVSLKDIVRKKNVEQVERKIVHICSSKAHKRKKK